MLLEQLLYMDSVDLDSLFTQQLFKNPNLNGNEMHKYVNLGGLSGGY